MRTIVKNLIKLLLVLLSAVFMLQFIGYKQAESDQTNQDSSFEKTSDEIAHYEQKLERIEKERGSRHLDVAYIYERLGGLYKSEGERQKSIESYGKALKLYEQVLKKIERQRGSKHIDVAHVCERLGGLYSAKGAQQKAIESYERALAIKERELGQDHDNVGRICFNLGELYTITRAHDKAMKTFLRALRIMENKPDGYGDLDVSYVCIRLGELYANQKAYTASLQSYKRALRMAKKSLESDHLYVALSHGGLGSTYEAIGERDQAIEHYKEALRILRKVRYPGDPYEKKIERALKRVQKTWFDWFLEPFRRI